jgi:hypothetical protein
LFGKIGVPGFEDGGKVNKKTKYSSYIIGGKVKKEKKKKFKSTTEILKHHLKEKNLKPGESLDDMVKRLEKISGRAI